MVEHTREKDNVEDAVLVGAEIEETQLTHLHATLKKWNEEFGRPEGKTGVDAEHFSGAKSLRLEAEEAIAATDVDDALPLEIDFVHQPQNGRMRSFDLTPGRRCGLLGDGDSVIPTVIGEPRLNLFVTE